MVQTETQSQATNQVCISNSIASLRLLSAHDWRDFVESMSTVEHTLREDPSGVYVRMDFSTRDSYRHAVERITRHSTRRSLTECEVAGLAVQLAVQSAGEVAGRDHVEQDEFGNFTKVSGPVLEMLDIQVDSLDGVRHATASAVVEEKERTLLRQAIDERRPFLDFVFHRTQSDGSRRQYRVSGEPMFDQSSRFLGYRGIGVEVPEISP